MDVNYLKYDLLMKARYQKPTFPLISIGKVATRVQYGISSLASSEPIGHPIIRMNNLQSEEWDFSDLKYIDLSNNEVQKYKLDKGDILFNRTNSKELVGKSGVFREEDDWVFASYLIRLTLDETKALPDFVSTFLHTQAGRIQIDRLSRQIIGMTNINAQEIRSLKIPLPSLELQNQFVQQLEDARARRKEKLAQADKLLAEVDEFVQRELGLCVPHEESKLAYGLSSRELIGRYDPHFHQPRFKKLENIINTIHHRKLGDLVSFSSQKWSPETAVEETFSYIEISGVNLQTGEITPNEIVVSEAPSRARMVVQKDDILVSLTRPHRGAVALVEPEYDNCIASTGFAVLREIKDTQINRLYLWCVLRTQICLQQMLQRSSGGSYPAITEEELKNTLIPIPEESVQEKIANEMLLRQRQAKALRQEAEYHWADAKAQFEVALLG